MLKLISDIDDDSKYILKNTLFNNDQQENNLIFLNNYYFFNEEIMDNILLNNFFSQKQSEYKSYPKKYENLINCNTKYNFRYDLAIINDTNPYGLVILEDIFYNFEETKLMKIPHPGYYNYNINICLNKKHIPSNITLHSLLNKIFNEISDLFQSKDKLINRQYNVNIETKNIVNDNISLFIIVDKLNLVFSKEKCFNNIKNSKLNYHGTINDDYDIKYDTYKLIIAENETRLIDSFKKTYKISRQVLNEDTLDNTRLLNILKSYKISNNKTDFSIYETNAILYLHRFEHRTFILQPNMFNIEILLLNMMNNTDTLIDLYLFREKIINKKPNLLKNIKNIVKIKNIDKNNLNGYFYNNMVNLKATEELYENLVDEENMYYEDIKNNDKYLKINLPFINNTENTFYMAFYVSFSLINNIFRIHIYDKAGFIYFTEDFSKIKITDELLKDISFYNLPILYFPDDVKNYIDTVKYFKKVKDFFKEIAPILKDEIYTYRNTINSFEIYEYNIKIDKNTDDIVIGYITHPEFCNYHNQKHTPFMNRFYNWLNTIIIKPSISKLISSENLNISNTYNFDGDVNLIYESSLSH